MSAGALSEGPDSSAPDSSEGPGLRVAHPAASPEFMCLDTPRVSPELSYQGGSITDIGSNMFSKKARDAGLPFCPARLVRMVS
jgi:hypothetical protein